LHRSKNIKFYLCDPYSSQYNSSCAHLPCHSIQTRSLSFHTDNRQPQGQHLQHSFDDTSHKPTEKFWKEFFNFTEKSISSIRDWPWSHPTQAYFWRWQTQNRPMQQKNYPTQVKIFCHRPITMFNKIKKKFILSFPFFSVKKGILSELIIELTVHSKW